MLITASSGCGDGFEAADRIPGSGASSEIELLVTRDEDDATWINGTDERRHFSAEQRTLEVGTDTEMGLGALRFSVPILPYSTIESAVLRLHRVSGTAAADATLRVQVFDTFIVEPFDDDHEHTPFEHVSAGVWTEVIGDFPAGAPGAFTSSPDLAPLLQHVIDKRDWYREATIGLLISPDVMEGWAQYSDSSAGTGQPRIRIVHRPD